MYGKKLTNEMIKLNELVRKDYNNEQVEEFELYFGEINQIIMIDQGITKIDCSALCEFAFLRKLILHGNDLAEIDRDLFKHSIYLEEINLSSNKLEQIDKDLFQGLIRLTHLDLSHNKLKSIDKCLFRNLYSLTYVWLNDNQLDAKSAKLELALERNVKFISFRGDWHENNIKLISHPDVRL